MPPSAVFDLVTISRLTTTTAWCPDRSLPASCTYPNATARQDNELGLALRWGYGSVFGMWHGLLRRRIGEPWASGVFGATLMTATLTMFPLLGRTPPPWRWPPSVIATAFGTHAAYVSAVAAVDDQVRRAFS